LLDAESHPMLVDIEEEQLFQGGTLFRGQLRCYVNRHAQRTPVAIALNENPVTKRG
jgi:hypothetical protein